MAKEKLISYVKKYKYVALVVLVGVVLMLLPTRGGIGRYPKDAVHPKRRTGWVHIDTRADKSRWSM